MLASLQSLSFSCGRLQLKDSFLFLLGLGRCPPTNVKIGRGRGDFDKREFVFD